MNDLLKMAIKESASLSSDATNNIYDAKHKIEKLYNNCQDQTRHLSSIFNIATKLPQSPESDQIKAALEELRLLKHGEFKTFQEAIEALKKASEQTSKSGSWANSIVASS